MRGAQDGPPWLTVVGCLPSGALAPTAPADVLAADHVFGAARLLAAAGVPEGKRAPWPRPFQDGIEAVLARRGRPTTVLASGDPLHHGIAATFLRQLAPSEMTIHPAPSAFSLAAAAMRWPLETVETVSLHTLPARDILLHAKPGQRIIALTRDADAPAAIAAALAGAGYGDSEVHVLEALGGPDEAVHATTADLCAGPFHPLNVVAVACVGKGPVTVDDLHHDGCVTRDEVRAITIAALPQGAHLWDIGAGSGAVAIDFVRRGGTATLFERDGDRAEAARRNLIVSKVKAPIVVGSAIDHLDDALPPGAIFLGGGVGDEALFQALWERLPAGGTFVSNAVTLSGEEASMARFGRLGGTLTRIQLSHAAPVGRLMAMRPAMSVLQWRVVKP
ncbi:MAG: precorrin-6y C5,15-methyltransferase (decarboxylating) subunit CbiE [Pseudomonadota bacterium]